MKHSTYDTQMPTLVRLAMHEVFNNGGIVHLLRKTRQKSVSVYELISSDAGGQRFEFYTHYANDTGTVWEKNFSLSGRELIRFAAIAADLDDGRTGTV